MTVSSLGSRPMTVQAFYAFTDTRPDEEKWGLFEGRPFLNVPRTYRHQLILRNLIFGFGSEERRRQVPWFSIPGIGVRASDVSRPQVDFMVLRDDFESRDPFGRDAEDAIVLCEIMSPETCERDLIWKRTVYTRLPSLTHYVVVAEDAVEVLVFARSEGFAQARIISLDAMLKFPSIGVELPLSEVYRDTGLEY